MCTRVANLLTERLICNLGAQMITSDLTTSSHVAQESGSQGHQKRHKATTRPAPKLLVLRTRLRSGRRFGWGSVLLSLLVIGFPKRLGRGTCVLLKWLLLLLYLYIDLT